MAARLLRTCEHSLFFMLCSVAIAPIKPDFVITELVFFIVFALHSFHCLHGSHGCEGRYVESRASK